MTELLISLAGEAVPLPAILNFAALKRAWPHIRALGEAADALDRVEAAIGIAAASLHRARPELTVAEIAERLRPDEIPVLAAAVPRLLERSGLVGAAPSGEREAVASTAISIG